MGNRNVEDQPLPSVQTTRAGGQTDCETGCDVHGCLGAVYTPRPQSSCSGSTPSVA